MSRPTDILPSLSRPARRRLPGALLGCALACAAATALSGCGNAVEDSPIGSAALEQIVALDTFPVYWLGNSFHGLALTATTQDPGGAYTFQYGNCLIGGTHTCVSPLEVISSPDTQFLPGAASGAVRPIEIRGASGLSSAGGKVIELPAGVAIVDIRARTGPLARAAAQAMAPINLPGSPGQRLPPRRRTDFASTATAAQKPAQVRLLPALPSAVEPPVGSGVPADPTRLRRRRGPARVEPQAGSGAPTGAGTARRSSSSSPRTAAHRRR